MSKRKDLLEDLIFAGLIMLTIIIACSCESPVEPNSVTGIIYMVGNDPFTQLAVNINDKDVYLLECTKEVQGELLKNQCHIYEVFYSNVYNRGYGLTLVVRKVIKK